jgi:cytochrome c oxidase subunit 2
MVGPSWQGLFGQERPLADGSAVVADENYIRESILEPNAKVAEGFQPVMPTYQGSLNDEQIEAIIEYIKTLK